MYQQAAPIEIYIYPPPPKILVDHDHNIEWNRCSYRSLRDTHVYILSRRDNFLSRHKLFDIYIGISRERNVFFQNLHRSPAFHIWSYAFFTSKKVNVFLLRKLFLSCVLLVYFYKLLKLFKQLNYFHKMSTDGSLNQWSTSIERRTRFTSTVHHEDDT